MKPKLVFYKKALGLHHKIAFVLPDCWWLKTTADSDLETDLKFCCDENLTPLEMRNQGFVLQKELHFAIFYMREFFKKLCSQPYLCHLTYPNPGECIIFLIGKNGDMWEKSIPKAAKKKELLYLADKMEIYGDLFSPKFYRYGKVLSADKIFANLFALAVDMARLENLSPPLVEL